MELVLVGGGHAHVQVLREWRRRPVGGVGLTAILDGPGSVYSGMVPGLVAGDYRAHQLEIDVASLARSAGARVRMSAARSIDPAARTIELADGSRVSYDVASLDVGATVRGQDLPGVREHALATRPIHSLIRRLDAKLALVGERPRVAVVGGGVAAVELGFTLDARLRAAGRRPDITLLSAADRLLPSLSVGPARRLAAEANRRGLTVRVATRAAGVAPGAILLADGERMDCDLAVWATGAAPLPFPATSPLPVGGDGFVRVRDTLQVEEWDDLFAVGDCATQSDAAWVPKAGVYAVRQGPVLDANLRAHLAGATLRSYRPQRDALVLVNLGHRRAIATKWGLAVGGRWVWRWKDTIDRRFMARFPTRPPAAD